MKLAIIGCGLIGQKRAAAALARSHRVAVVCDRDAGRAAALAQRVKADGVVDPRDAIAADVDAVVVATSHDGLASIAIAAVAAGKHVLVEKPAGRDLRELEELRAAAHAAGVSVKVGFNHRFHPGLATAKKLAADGALGPLYYLRGRYGHGGRVGYESEWRCQRDVSGGGELIDQGSHLIDLSRWFMGDLTLDYSSLPTFFWDIAVEDNCFIALSGDDGRRAWLHATWTEWKNMFSFEITGRDGKLTVDGLGGSYGVERLTHHRMLPGMGPPETTIWEYPFPDTSWDVEFAAFEAALAGQPTEIADIDDACAVFAIIDAAYKRAER
jgi:predicted dehydrogenase